jgi:hypothetical protein
VQVPLSDAVAADSTLQKKCVAPLTVCLVLELARWNLSSHQTSARSGLVSNCHTDLKLFFKTRAITDRDREPPIRSFTGNLHCRVAIVYNFPHIAVLNSYQLTYIQMHYLNYSCFTSRQLHQPYRSISMTRRCPACVCAESSEIVFLVPTHHLYY